MNKNLKKIVYCALYAAIATVLTIFQIPIGNDIFELNLAPAIVILSGVMLGPGYGASCGFIADLLGTVITGMGYNPLFSISAALYGVIPALVIKNTPASFPRSLAAVSLTQGICSIVLNTLWIYILYGPGLTLIRLAGSLCSMAAYILIFYLLQKKLSRYSLRHL